MLNEINVSNFAIIDKVSIQFKPGFNVLSGETGSGKSIILRSLALLMGEKSTADFIKSNTNQSSVDGAFDISHRTDVKARLESMGLPMDDDTLVVRRVISRDGKNRVYINGSLATLSQLKDLVSPLVEVTGRLSDEGIPLSPLIEMTSQHENRNLQSKAYHLELLDQYLGLTSETQKVREMHQQLQEVKEQVIEIEKSARDKNQRLDFLRFQHGEISDLNLKPGSIEEIETQTELLRNSEKLTEFFSMAESTLYSDEDSALVRLHRVLQAGNEFSRLNPDIKNLADNLGQAKTLLEECVYELRGLNKEINIDSGDGLERLEQKLSDIRRVQTKYGNSTQEILQAFQQIGLEIEQLENSETVAEQLMAQQQELENVLDKLAKALHKKRAKGLTTLVDSVQAELQDLNMKGLLFGAKINTLPHPGPTGLTDIEFTIQATKSDTPRPLAKFASGGELSRILLSLKRVVGQSDWPMTYLFDEVDAGVSGVTAEKVGRKLKAISKGSQVICVTHLPQVAAFADNHFVIQKQSSQGQVRLSVEGLNKSERVEELARMISGEKISKTSLAHAKELIEDSI